MTEVKLPFPCDADFGLILTEEPTHGIVHAGDLLLIRCTSEYTNLFSYVIEHNGIRFPVTAHSIKGDDFRLDPIDPLKYRRLIVSKDKPLLLGDITGIIAGYGCDLVEQ